MEGLKSSQVHRKLDAKLKIIGFEIMDLLAILMLAAFNNLFLGRTSFAPVFVLVIPSIVAVGLYLVKRNKPEGFLVHWLRYVSSPGVYSSGQVNHAIEEKRRRLIV